LRRKLKRITSHTSRRYLPRPERCSTLFSLPASALRRPSSSSSSKQQAGYSSCEAARAKLAWRWRAGC
jgi:hypothetical protein